MPDQQRLSTVSGAPQQQQPYSALGDLFASGLYQAPWSMPSQAAPRFNAGMQTLMPNSPTAPTLPVSGLPQMNIGAAAAPNAAASPYLPGPTYARGNFHRSY